MSQFDRAVGELSNAELDEMATAAACLLRCAEILDRRGVQTNDPIYFKISNLAEIISARLLKNEGEFNLIQRLRRVENALRDAFRSEAAPC